MKRLLGIVLIVVGIILAGATVMRLDRDDMAQRATVVPPTNESPGMLSTVALPLVAALTFASGIVLLSVGAGRWNNPRSHSEPGDAVVNPEAHDKMNHV